MHKSHIKVFLLMLSIIFSACHREAENGSNKNTIIDLENDSPKDYLVSDLFKSAEFIPLETTNESRLTEINEVLFFDGIYVILDIRQKCLFGFDKNGRFRFKIFPKGKGPLELNNITDYTINKKNKSIDIYDFSQRKIVSFDMLGNPLHEKKIDFFFREFACTSKGDYIIYAPDLVNSESVGSGAFVIDSLGKFERSFLKIDAKGKYIQPINCLSGYGDSIILVSNYTKDIFIINNDKINKRFTVNYPNDWMQSLMLSNGSGSLLNFVYLKKLDDPKSFSVFLNAITGREYHLNFILNDLFALPITIPHLFKDSQTLLVFLNAEQKNDFQKILSQKNLPPDFNKKLLNQLKLTVDKMEPSDNYLMIKLDVR
ncbi:6-bladed beta-propeller [Pedobacter sp. Hv1]|uniref:6-bladed beta-propeller n=1 Tax=Pedobacter sp. Hv1 TaxID=1740090 RepID=UPI000AE808BD|nr:6-bladed beta-propeller [Pedobacter sp. Hv1]